MKFNTKKPQTIQLKMGTAMDTDNSVVKPEEVGGGWVEMDKEGRRGGHL